MKKSLYILCFFLLSVTFGGEFSLKNRLKAAKSGDYVVTETGKTITLLAVRSVGPKSIVFEEISVPSQTLQKRPTSWVEWVKAKAPGHSSWSMIEIDTETGTILECYSFSRSAWVQLSAQDSLLATLLKLPLQRVDNSDRKKIGPPPLPGEADFRKTWSPPLIFEGKSIEGALFSVFETQWPQDGSELATKKVALYFDEEIRFPLPYWIQIDTTHFTGNIRTIDAGKNLPAVNRALPRRMPQFITAPKKTEKGISLTLKSPAYYRQFELFAIDITEKEKHFCPVMHKLLHKEGEIIDLEIEEEDLKQTLTPQHRYTWLVVPVGYNESYTEYPKPFIWNP